MVLLTLFFTGGCSDESEQSCPDVNKMTGPYVVPPGCSIPPPQNPPNKAVTLPPTTPRIPIIPEPPQQDLTILNECTNLAIFVEADPDIRVPNNSYKVDNCYTRLSMLNPRLSKQAGRVMNSLSISKSTCQTDYAIQGKSGALCE